jgi:pyrimidine deaminase RibD-like protein
MRIVEFSNDDYKIHNRPKLDQILVELCHQVIKGKQDNPMKYGMVAACVLDPDNRKVIGVNEAAKDGTRRHAERVAMDRYEEQYGEILEGSIIITTLSPCNEDGTEMADERYGESCTDIINDSKVRKVYCGYIDPSQDNEHNEYTLEETSNQDIKKLCKQYADTFLKNDIEENFADGKHPEDKGDSARHGIPKHASISSLRKIAHQGGRKGQLAHWQANMRAGRAKNNQ